MKTNCLCLECMNHYNENSGKWLILNEDNEKFNISFICINCIKDWRKRCLLREGYNQQEIKILLEKEYPKTI